VVRQLKAADLLRDRAGEGPLLVAEQLAFQETRGNGRAVELDEGSVPPGTQVVKGAGDQLLACARLATDEHGGVGRGDDLDLLQHPAQRRVLADDLPEVVVGADLLYQVEILLGQPVFQFGDLFVSLKVLNRKRDLVRDLT
jgi:hypothetical protein